MCFSSSFGGGFEAKYWSSARVTGSTLVWVDEAMLSEADWKEKTESVGDEG